MVLIASAGCRYLAFRDRQDSGSSAIFDSSLAKLQGLNAACPVATCPQGPQNSTPSCRSDLGSATRLVSTAAHPQKVPCQGRAGCSAKASLAGVHICAERRLQPALGGAAGCKRRTEALAQLHVHCMYAASLTVFHRGQARQCSFCNPVTTSPQRGRPWQDARHCASGEEQTSAPVPHWPRRPQGRSSAL